MLNPLPASLHKVFGPLLLEIEKTPGVDFGTELVIRQQQTTVDGGETKRKAVFVHSIVPASIADRFV
jgi:hypothetical protein